MTLFEFQKLIISTNSPFLGKDKELKELYDISTDTQKLMLISLFQKFYSITMEEKKNYRKTFAEAILNNIKLLNKPIIFSTLVENEFPDSGQKIIPDVEFTVRQEVRRIQLTDSSFKPELYFKNNFGKLHRALNKDPDKVFNVILIDEFIGSGSTLLNRLRQLYSHTNIKEVHLFFFAGMKYAIDNILTEYPTLKPHIYRQLKKGISEQLLSKDEIDGQLKQMYDLEKNLSPTQKDRNLNLYSLGYNQAESLYNNELIEGNIPNNVFPIFWWEKDNKNNIRNTIFFRVDDHL